MKFEVKDEEHEKSGHSPVINKNSLNMIFCIDVIILSHILDKPVFRNIIFSVLFLWSVYVLRHCCLLQNHVTMQYHHPLSCLHCGKIRYNIIIKNIY